MMIVLDTNILVSDFHQSGSIFKVFLDGFYDAGHSLFTLLIVVDETANKYKENLYKLKQDEEKLNNEIQRLTKEKRKSSFTEDWIQKKVEEYRQYLIKTFKDSAGTSARLIDYPNIHHNDLVAKALARKKPFSVKGTGYRDALIWENLLWIAKTYSGSEKIAFISNNTKDFADNQLFLHSDLVSDLERNKIDKNAVVFYSSLEDFVKEQISAKYEALGQLKQQLNKDFYKDIDFKKLLLTSLNEDLPYLARSTNQKGFTSNLLFECEEIEIYEIENIISYEVVDARRPNAMTQAEILLNIDIVMECQIIAHMHNSRWNSLQKTPFFIVQEQNPKHDMISFKAIIKVSINSFFSEISDEANEPHLFGISMNVHDIKISIKL